jgi:uncharacterized protein YdaU (DUF1376 family)
MEGFRVRNGLPYYKAYPRDFIEGTIGMPFEIKCAYRVILDLIYMQGGNLPDDDRYISGLLGCSIRKWKSIRSDLISRGKLDVSDGFLTNKRARKELETLAKLQHNQSEKASRPRKNNSLQQPRHSQPEPEPEPEKKEEDTSVSSKKKRGSRLRDDWLLPRDWGEWAVEQGMDPDAVRAEAERFRDYWIAKAGREASKLDWQATWRNWIRSSIQRNPKKAQSNAVSDAKRIADIYRRKHGMDCGPDQGVVVPLLSAGR